MKNNKFDILNNADDNIVEELVPFSSDDENTRKRVYSMSVKKYNEMNKNFETAPEGIVRGVEEYRRPIWTKFAAAAAAVAIVAGGVGTYSLMKGVNKPSESSPAADASQTVVPSDEGKENGSANVNLGEIGELPSEEEMKNVFEKLLPVYMDKFNINASTRVDDKADSVSYYMYGGPASEACGASEEMVKDGNLYYRYTWYKLNDSRFSNIEEMKAYYSAYCTASEIDGLGALDWNDKEPGSIVEGDKNRDVALPFLIENGGDLYAYKTQKSGEQAPDPDAVIADKPLYATPDSFVWERISKGEGPMGEEVFVIDLSFAKEDGVWKIDGGLLYETAFDPTIDYADLDVTLMDYDYYAPEAYTSPETETETEVTSEASAEASTESEADATHHSPDDVRHYDDYVNYDFQTITDYDINAAIEAAHAYMEQAYGRKTGSYATTWVLVGFNEVPDDFKKVADNYDSSLPFLDCYAADGVNNDVRLLADKNGVIVAVKDIPAEESIRENR